MLRIVKVFPLRRVVARQNYLRIELESNTNVGSLMVGPYVSSSRSDLVLQGSRFVQIVVVCRDLQIYQMGIVSAA